MILKVFSIFDSKVGAFMPPMFFRSKLEAIRAVTDAANSKENNIGKYPDDYTLFELGDWFDDSAKFVLKDTPVSIGVCVEFVKV